MPTASLLAAHYPQHVVKLCHIDIYIFRWDSTVSFSSLCVHLLIPCLVPFKVSLQRTVKKFLQLEHPTAEKFLRFYRAAAKKFLQFPGPTLKWPAISCKKDFFLRMQKEVLAHALFLGCTACPWLVSILFFVLIQLLCHKILSKGSPWFMAVTFSIQNCCEITKMFWQPSKISQKSLDYFSPDPTLHGCEHRSNVFKRP